MKTIFNQKYNRDNYLEFLENYLLPDDFQIEEENVTNDLSFTPQKINEITYLGKSNSLDISVYEMKHESEHDPRVTLSREAFKIMANFSKRKALVFFISENAVDFRFSLITIDLKLEGRKVTKLFSNPRRYSFLLGEQAKIGTLHDKLLKSRKMEATERVTDFEDILNRFSVESVSKQFFIEYKRLFEEIKEIFGKIPTLQILLAKNENLNIDIFARKLLGQIVFIYFMQRKKWLGGNPQNKNWNDGKQNFLRWAFDYCIQNNLNFYEHFLESLFYKGLNEKDTSFEFNSMFIKVPYLNGGLFEKFYDKDETLVIYPPNELFSNGENGILDVFDRYNFTIDENTFFEQDVAIDPEMLGKVFENLLDENLRKGKGAFYTPREIVSYMTRESLKNYLKTALQKEHPNVQKNIGLSDRSSDCLGNQSSDKNSTTFGRANAHSEVSLKIDHLFEYKDLYIENTKTELEEYGENFEAQFYEMLDIVEEVNEKLKTIKTVDPAIGSGAFSIGLLHEIVSLRQYIEDQFLNNKISNYILKKETIQNNIYGVDIDNGAVEIAKLRFWLSLVVDAENPEALPNLDYKIMQGNSLIESFGGININQVDAKINDILDERKKYEKQIDILSKEINKVAELMAYLNKNAITEGIINSDKIIDLQKNYNSLIKEKNKITKKIKKITDSLPADKIRVEEDTQIEHLHELQSKLYNCDEKLHKAELRDEIENTIVKIFHSKIELEKDSYFKAETKMIQTANRFPTNDQRAKFLDKERSELKKKFNFDYLALENQLHEFTKKDKVRPFFPWHLYFADVFKDNDGFDIVIGNPPYIQLQKFSGQQIQKDYEEQKFESFAKTGDIYALFYEKGNMLLKENGILAFITSNKWMRANYGKKLRKYFSEKTLPIQLIDFGGYKVFESATVDTNILVFKKKEHPNVRKNIGLSDWSSDCLKVNQSSDKNSTTFGRASHIPKLLACTIRNGFTRETNIAKYVKQNGIELSNFSEESWIISTKEEFAIKQKIEKIGTPLKDWDIKINYGIKTGFNEAFIISGAKKDELIAQDPKSAEIIKPILRGRDIKRYKAEFADLWLIATFPALHLNIDDFPVVKKYLENYLPKIKQTGETFIDESGNKQKTRKKTGNEWFETQDQIAYYEEFEKEKIVYPNMTKYRPFILDKKRFLTNQKCFIMTSESNLQYPLAILNSWVFEFAFKDRFPELLGGTRELSKVFFINLPIPKISSEKQKPFEILVDQILQKKEQNENTPSLRATPLQEGNTLYLENQIDIMVYKLYELTYEEVKIVDSDFDKVLAEFGLSKEDFERMSLEELGELEVCL